MTQARPAVISMLICTLLAHFATLSAICGTHANDVVLVRQDDELFELIAESDVVWSIDDFGRAHLQLSGASATLRDMDDPPIDQLAAIRGEPARFIPAFIVLHELIMEGRGIQPFMRDDGWQLNYHGLKVLLRSDEDGRYSATYPGIEHWMPFLIEHTRPYNAEFRMEWMLEDTFGAEETETVRQLSLIGRTRDGIDEIVNDDVSWETRGCISLFPVLSGASNRVSRSRPSIEVLVELLTDPDRFIAAHVLLTHELGHDGTYSGTTPDSICSCYNGLHFQLKWSSDGDAEPQLRAEYPQLERQQEILQNRWRSQLVVRGLP